jgi:ketosteroid isomerase-like protein
MAADHVEAVRAIYEQWAEGDFETSQASLDPHVVFILDPGFPDSGVYHGAQALAGYVRGFLEPWEHLTIEAEELVSAGDTVLASVRQRGAGMASGITTELRYFTLWSFRADRVIRIESFRDRSEALQAAGLPLEGA